MIPFTLQNLPVFLSAIASAFRASGRAGEAGLIDDALAAYRAGKNIDGHMSAIAAALDSQLPIDYAELRNRLNQKLADFTGNQP